MNIPPDDSCHFQYPTGDRKAEQEQQLLVVEKVGADVTGKSIEDTLLAEKLMDAVQDKHYGLCQVLLCLRARGDLVCEERGGMAPIHLAVGLEPLGDSLDFLRLLLQYGANPNIRATCGGITPVHLSAMLQKPKAMKLLLASGGDPDILDQDEKSAFHHGWDSEKIRRILQKYLKEQQSSSSSNSSSSDCSSSDMDIDPKFSPLMLPKKKVRRPLVALDAVNRMPSCIKTADIVQSRTRRPATTDKEATKCDLCSSLKRRRHFDKTMMKSMGVHFSKYHSVKLGKSESVHQSVDSLCPRCFCSEKRMNFSYPLERKLKLWYECNAGKESFMKNLVKSLPAVSPSNLMKHKRPSIKVEIAENVCRRFSSGQTNIYHEVNGAESKDKTEALVSGSENEPISSNESLSSQNSNPSSTCSSIESAKNLLNMQITEKDLDKISLVDGEAVGLKPNAQLDVSSPNNPVIREKRTLSDPDVHDGTCTCRCSNHRRISEMDVTVAPGRRSLSLSNEKLTRHEHVTKDASICYSPLNNQQCKPRKSFTNSPLLFWKKKNNLEVEKDLLKTPKLLETDLALTSAQAQNQNLFATHICVANGMELTPRAKVSIPLERPQMSKYTQCSPHTTDCQLSGPGSDSEFWDTIDSENVNPKLKSPSRGHKLKSQKKSKQRHAHSSTKCNECGSKIVSPGVQTAIEKCSPKSEKAKSILCGSALYRDDFTGGFKTGLEKVSRIEEVTGSSTTSRKTIASGRRVTFSDQASSHYSNPNSSDDNNISPLSNEDISSSSSVKTTSSNSVSPSKFYRSIFNRSNSKRVSNCSKVSSELIREGDFVFEQVFIKPKSEESLLTNDLSDHSFNTSFVTCKDWKSCRTASTRQNSIRSASDPLINSSRVEQKETSENNRANQETVQEQDSIRVTDNLHQLSNEEIFDRLKSLNCSKYGPVTDTTRSIYLKILAGFQARLDGSFEKLSIESQKESVMAIQTEYSRNPNEFPRLLSDYLLVEERARTGASAAASVVTSLPDLEGEEQLMTSLFGDPKRNWREGKRKKSFNYLLLDPRVTKNLQNRSRDLSEIELFGYFVRAIFYVGKGQASRPLSHFNEAVRHTKSASTSLPEKISHIKDIWESGYGVVNLQCFQNAIPAEAYTREALMIGALGLNRLTNQRKGDCYGVCSTWPDSRRQQLGIYLLKKAMRIFLQDGERQIKPTDF